jgi:hypothetical protein
MLIVVFAECHIQTICNVIGECRYAECRGSKGFYLKAQPWLFHDAKLPASLALATSGCATQIGLFLTVVT